MLDVTPEELRKYCVEFAEDPHCYGEDLHDAALSASFIIDRLQERIAELELELQVLQDFRDSDRKALETLSEFDGDSDLWAVMKTQRDDARLRIAELEQQVAALRADAERLDWIEENARYCGGGSSGTYSFAVASDVESGMMRDAIDAARTRG